ncbi:MAG: hypothetical protein Q9204_002166 [Flavoplaca sp. TL-2023a]
MSDQQPKSVITQSQHVDESLPAPLSSAILEVDDLLGYPEVNGGCLATNEIVNSEASVAQNPMMKEEQTESGSIGLGIHIPGDHPQSMEAVGSLFRPIDTRGGTITTTFRAFHAQDRNASTGATVDDRHIFTNMGRQIMA